MEAGALSGMAFESTGRDLGCRDGDGDGAVDDDAVIDDEYEWDGWMDRGREGGRAGGTD